MTVLTLLEKCYSYQWKSYLRDFEASLVQIFQNLEVQVKVLGRSNEDWIQIEVVGSDTEIVTNYLIQKFGLAPLSYETIQLFSILKGRVIDSEKIGYGLYIDVGISRPKHVDVLIPLYILRSQLAKGKKLSVKDIINSYCLHDNFPMVIQVTKLHSVKREIEGRLSVGQTSLFNEWTFLNFDRVIILGASSNQVKRLLKRSRLDRDIIKIISLGFLEQLLLCKLGTTGPGIIKKIGPMLPKTPIYIFSPSRIRTLLAS
jgi:hypothetical protein